MRTDGDYISREAALRLIEQYCGEAAHAGYYDAAIRFGSVYREVEDIPAADVRPVVRGKWLGTHDGFYYTYSCSECGYEALYKENTKDQVCSSFCPSCGAWMEES